MALDSRYCEELLLHGQEVCDQLWLHDVDAEPLVYQHHLLLLLRRRLLLGHVYNVQRDGEEHHVWDTVQVSPRCLAERELGRRLRFPAVRPRNGETQEYKHARHPRHTE